jgi:hypothetical protein
MTIADHPLHRSGRAALPHPALALGRDGKARLESEPEQREATPKRINVYAISVLSLPKPSFAVRR